jgi:protein-L-isoaspartate(D-aspartate) O-methyltransferase
VGTPEDLVRAARAFGVRDPRLLAAIRETPRAGFVPSGRAACAYADSPIPIAHGQVTTQPSLVAAVVEALDLTGGESVLEVGTGLGWQTALLARLARTVWSVERFADLAADARANLARSGIRNATVVSATEASACPSARRSTRSSSRPRSRASPRPSRASSPRADGSFSRSARAAATTSSASRSRTATSSRRGR